MHTPDDAVSHTMYRRRRLVCRRFIADNSRNFNTMHCVCLFLCVCVRLCVCAFMYTIKYRVC